MKSKEIMELSPLHEIWKAVEEDLENNSLLRINVFSKFFYKRKTTKEVKWSEQVEPPVTIKGNVGEIEWMLELQTDGEPEILFKRIAILSFRKKAWDFDRAVLVDVEEAETDVFSIYHADPTAKDAKLTNDE